MRKFIIALTLAASACTSGPAPVEGGNPTGGLVTAAFRSDEEAMAGAQQHCAKYGKSARISGVIRPGTWSFDCVTR
jgi:hypothetical protein